jgi:hypothetical protein
MISNLTQEHHKTITDKEKILRGKKATLLNIKIQ